MKCVDSNGNDPKPFATNFAKAKELCSDEPDCLMFYDECGEGEIFRKCPKLAGQIISTCGGDDPDPTRNKRRDVLYIKGKY